MAAPYLVECKLTGKRTLDLRLSVIEKIDAEAVEAGLTPAVALRLAALDSDVEPDWVLVPLRVLIGIARQ